MHLHSSNSALHTNAGTVHKTLYAHISVSPPTDIDGFNMKPTIYSLGSSNFLTLYYYLLRYWKKIIWIMYCLMETYTDSLYIAISRPTLDECVCPDRFSSWQKQKYDYFVSERVVFEGQEITLAQYEKREPGKYKLEFNKVEVEIKVRQRV